MRLAKNFLCWAVVFLVASPAVISCRTSKKTSSSFSSNITVADSLARVTDTSKKSSLNVSVQTTNYGDTLSGSLQFTKEQIDAMDSMASEKPQIDSIESSGIKVVMELVKTKHGIKTKVKAIAKPKQVVNTTITANQEQQGKDSVAEKKKQTQTTSASQTVVVKRWPAWQIIGGSLFIIFLVLGILIYKAKNYG